MKAPRYSDAFALLRRRGANGRALSSPSGLKQVAFCNKLKAWTKNLLRIIRLTPDSFVGACKRKVKELFAEFAVAQTARPKHWNDGLSPPLVSHKSVDLGDSARSPIAKRDAVSVFNGAEAILERPVRRNL